MDEIVSLIAATLDAARTGGAEVAPQAANNLEPALAVWELARRLFPHCAAPYRDAIGALKRRGRLQEAHTIADAALAAFPEQDWPLAEKALLALDLHDFFGAIHCAEAIRSGFAHAVGGYLIGAVALRGAGREDEAVQLLSDAVSRFADDPVPLEKLTWFTLESGAYERAMAHAAAARDKFPDHSSGYLSGLAAMRALRQFGEAEALLAQAQARFPGEAWTAEEAVHLARDQERWPQTLARADALARAHPDRPTGLMFKAFALRQLKEFDQASRVAFEATRQFPGQPWPWVELGWIATVSGQTDLALARWADVRRQFPDSPSGYAQAARIAIATGRFDAAKAALADAPAALRAGVDVDGLVQDLAAAEAAFASRPQTPARAVTADDGQADAVHLTAAFESLAGTSQGCEFGLLQRAFGVERIGLLRWAYMTGPTLTAALEHAFDGVGEPEQTELLVYRHVNGEEEYVTKDRRFNMQMHTFIKASDAPFDVVYKQSCRRLKFLRGKMLEDLRESRRIFVFKLGDDLLSDAALDRLHGALTAFGDNMLLYVRQAGPGYPAASVQLLRRGLVVGALARLSQTADGTVHPPDMDGWMQICTETYRLWQAHVPLASSQLRSTAMEPAC